jgi:hypothetical protein
MENGTIKKSSLYLPEDWQDWLRETSKCTGKSMQSIIFEALKQWREAHVAEIEKKIEALQAEYEAQTKKLQEAIAAGEAALAAKSAEAAKAAEAA